MGYSTDYYGEFNVVPPLNKKEIAFFKAFNETRRCVRSDDSGGRYYVTDGKDNWGQNTSNITEMNNSPVGQPSLWCGFHASDDGTSIVWDGGEKTYSGPEWIKYFMVHFLNPMALMKEINPEAYEKHGFQPHVVNGVMFTRGEEVEDSNKLQVIDNRVYLSEVDKDSIQAFLNEGAPEQDEDSDEDELDEHLYDKWYQVDGDVLAGIAYGAPSEVKYESESGKELELENVQAHSLSDSLKNFKQEIAQEKPKKLAAKKTGKQSSKKSK